MEPQEQLIYVNVAKSVVGTPCGVERAFGANFFLTPEGAKAGLPQEGSALHGRFITVPYVVRPAKPEELPS